jgi:hypothetical protein
MSICTCPEDGRFTDPHRRVILIEPGAERREGNIIVRDPSKVHVYDKECPVHGYTVLTEE